MIRSLLTRKSPHAHSEVDINLTPMLDVVFILLIFFIITTSFIQEAGINVALSQAKSATPQEASIRVSIDQYGEIWFKDQVIDIRTLQSVLRKMYLENPQSAVIILADNASDNASLVKVLDQVHRAGITNIAIAAKLNE